VNAQLYCITCKINGWKYWGMTYRKNYLNRYKEHLSGKGGKYLYKGMLKYGKTNFYIKLIEEGSFEHIQKREIQECKNTLFKHSKGWNGNVGKAIYCSKDSLKKTKNTIKNKPLSQILNWRYSIPSNWRGKTKYNCEKLKRQSESLKKRWKNPTKKMLLGKIKEAKTKSKQTKYNCERLKKHSNSMKGRFLGENNNSFRGWWITPYGKYDTLKKAGLSIGYKIPENVKKFCVKNIKITNCILKRTNLPLNFLNKRSFDVGFSFLPK